MKNETTQPNHTPTPWKLDNEFNQIQGPKGETIVMSFGKTATKSDRELIVTAVNSHEELLAENKQLKGRIEALINNHGLTKAKIEVAALQSSNAELLEALKSVRRHGLIESDGYETIVRQVGEAISKAEGKS